MLFECYCFCPLAVSMHSFSRFLHVCVQVLHLDLCLIIIRVCVHARNGMLDFFYTYWYVHIQAFSTLSSCVFFIHCINLNIICTCRYSAWFCTHYSVSFCQIHVSCFALADEYCRQFQARVREVLPVYPSILILMKVIFDSKSLIQPFRDYQQESGAFNLCIP